MSSWGGTITGQVQPSLTTPNITRARDLLPPQSMSRLVGVVSGGFEDALAFLVGEQVADMADRLPKLIIGSRGGLSDQGLQL